MELEFKEYTLLELLPEGPYTNEFDFSGIYVDPAGKTHNVTVFNTAYFIENATFYYHNRKASLPRTLSSARAMFADLFTQWKNSRGNLYIKQAYAYTLSYNPIENYSSVEQMTDDITTHEHGYNRARSFTDYKEKEDFHNSDTTTDTETIVTSPTDTSTEEKMAFNSSEFSGDLKTTKGGNIIEKHNPTEEGEDPGNVKIDHTGYIEHTTTGSYTDQDGGTDTDRHQYTLTKAGNIGVLTPAEMLEKEFRGLMQDLAFRAFREFLDRYTYYCESIEGWW